MIASENKIIQSLTGKANLETVSVQELEALVKQHPSFPTGHLLLTKKLLLQDEAEAALIQKQRAAVYFSNTFWLNYLVNNLPEKTLSTPASAITETEYDIVIAEPVIDSASLQEPGVTDAQEEPAKLQTIEIKQEDEAFIAEEPLVETAFLPEPVVVEVIEETAPAETITVEEERAAHSEIIIEAENTVENVVSTDDFNVDRKEFAEHLLADADVDNADADNTDEEVTEDEPLKDFNPMLSKVLSEQAVEFNKPVEEDAKLPIESEPYYTVDYFDSQGIRLDPSQLNKDQLGRKVRKFTDWLKDMKRTGNQPSDLGTDPEMEKAIQTIAASSNETKEIVTEAMAEVLIKEGKQAKAIKLYEKLSFLNPDKTAYFAAKIDQIKGLS